MRGAGKKWDLRKDEPYSIYDRFDFDVPIGHDIPRIGAVLGDCWNRYKVRMDEMKESVRIIRQILNQKIPEGPIMAQYKAVRPPAGEIFDRSEAPRGELGFYIVSDGSGTAYRVRVRPPSFFHFQAFDRLIRGGMVSDVVAVLGSLNIIAGELDR